MITLTKGSVRRVTRTRTSRTVGSLLTSVLHGEPSSRAEAFAEPDLAASVAYLLASDPDDRRGQSRKLDDRLIVHACVAASERASRIPTVSELSRAAHVSERRLNSAFVDTHGVPPHQFFMTWALDLARRRLIASDPDKVTVTWIATGTGFNHLGRFARYYRKTYGESPSETLRRDQSTEGTVTRS
jgi:AraC-like DNA-binding protein